VVKIPGGARAFCAEAHIAEAAGIRAPAPRLDLLVFPSRRRGPCVPIIDGRTNAQSQSQLLPGSNAELLEYFFEVLLHGPRVDGETRGDLRGGEAKPDKSAHFGFPSREFRKPAGYFSSGETGIRHDTLPCRPSS
jgi:hypothetical protein